MTPPKTTSTEGGEPRLATDAVCMSFSGVQALQEVSLVVRRSEILGLIGPNGSGKTTLLNVVSGVYKPNSGLVYVNDVRAGGRSPHLIVHLGMARTFQNIRLFGHLTVRENVMVGSFSGAKREGVDHEADATSLLERFGLDDVADEHAMSLPYGAQRRVEIARALAGRPDYLLLDEPAAGLNDAESDALLESIRAVRDEFGCGIVVVDHDLRLIMRLCDRIHVLAEGKTLAVGSPQEVRENQAVIDVFLGEAVRELL